jgi:hypothetical protein
MAGRGHPAVRILISDDLDSDRGPGPAVSVTRREPVNGVMVVFILAATFHLGC